MRVKETEKRKILRQTQEDFCEAMHVLRAGCSKLSRKQLYTKKSENAREAGFCEEILLKIRFYFFC
jgi:hypothetical protein